MIRRIAMRMLVPLLATGTAWAAEPQVEICLLAHSDNAQAARYRVIIDWNGFSADGFERIDLGAEDRSGDIWPQFRDDRLQPRARQTSDIITVSDVSGYPLAFYLVGFKSGAVAQFNEECRNGFCSFRLPAANIVEIGKGASIASVENAPGCGSNQ